MNKAFRCFRSMRMTGLEPARRGHQNLNLARLPIPPHPHFIVEKISGKYELSAKVRHRGFEPRTT